MKNRKVITEDILYAGNVKFLKGIDDPGSTQMRNDIQAAADQAKAVAVRADVALAAISESAQLSMVRLVVSATSITRNRTGAYTPAAIIIKAQGMEGVSYYGRFRVETSDDGETYTASYASDHDENQYEYTLSTGDYIRIRLYQKGGLAVLLQEAIIVVTDDAGNAPVYWGPLEDAPIEGVMLNDYYFDANTPGSGGGILRYYNGTAWVEMTSAHALYQQATWAALADMVAWATEQSTVIAAASAIIVKLVTSDAFIENLYAQNITVPDTGKQRWYNGQGVNRRAIEMYKDWLSFYDSPLTTPASDEVLAARIGRIGVGGPPILDGDWQAPIESVWSTAAQIDNNGPTLAACELSNGKKYVFYPDGDNSGYLTMRTKARGATAWSSPTVINNGPGLMVSACVDSAGTIHVAYNTSVGGGLVERRIVDDVVGDEILIYASTDALNPEFYETANGELFCVFIMDTSYYIYESACLGASWDTPVQITESESNANNTFGFAPYALDDGRVILYYRQNDTLFIYRVKTDGVWGAVVATEVAGGKSPKIIQVLDGEIWLTFDDPTTSYIIKVNITGVHADYPQATLLAYAAGFDREFVQLSNGELWVVYSVGSPVIYERTLQRYAQIGAGIIKEGGDATNGYWEKWGNGKLVQYGRGITGAGGIGTVVTPKSHADLLYHVMASSSVVPGSYWVEIFPTNGSSPIYGERTLNSFKVQALQRNTTTPISSVVFEWRTEGRWK